MYCVQSCIIQPALFAEEKMVLPPYFHAQKCLADVDVQVGAFWPANAVCQFNLFFRWEADTFRLLSCYWHVKFIQPGMVYLIIDTPA